MTKVKDLHQKWMKNEEYRKAHAELAPEFALARAVMEARRRGWSHAGATRAAHEHYAICNCPA